MYIPHYYKEEDRSKLIAFMRSNSFGVLVSHGPNGLHGTHLPFVIEERGEELALVTHLAKANPQWEAFAGGSELLAIFTGPHGYVSPSSYEKKESVPTWNYVAVHACGKAAVIRDNAAVMQVLEKMIVSYEPAYREHWNSLPADYKQKMIKGIVAFEIVVTKLEGKYKLSQNKTSQEQDRIIEAFENSGQPEIAGAMKKQYGK
jgi:transcriptional regulator